MIKKVILAIVIVLIMGGTYFLFMNYKEPPIQVLDEYLKNATMEIKEGTLTNAGCTIIITDTEKEEKHTYGEDYEIYVYKDDKWELLNTGEGWYHPIGILPNKDNKIQMDINWEPAYGKLKPGKYKLEKKSCRIPRWL